MTNKAYMGGPEYDTEKLKQAERSLHFCTCGWVSLEFSIANVGYQIYKT